MTVPASLGDFHGAPDPAASTLPQSVAFDSVPRLQTALFDRGASVRAAIKAGVLGIFIGMIPILGVVLTGSLAVFFYRREKGIAPATAISARIGAAAGVVAFAINSLLIAVRIFALHAKQEYLDNLVKVAQTLGYNMADPENQAIIHNLFTPAGLALTFIFGMIFTVLLSAVGGALAAVLFRPSSRS